MQNDNTEETMSSSEEVATPVETPEQPEVAAEPEIDLEQQQNERVLPIVQRFFKELGEKGAPTGWKVWGIKEKNEYYTQLVDVLIDEMITAGTRYDDLKYLADAVKYPVEVVLSRIEYVVNKSTERALGKALETEKYHEITISQVDNYLKGNVVSPIQPA